jgi:HK97 family phage major capsid protein
MSDYVKTLITERNKAWEQAKEILERCATDKRERSAEENEMFDRANADIDRLGGEIADWTRNAEIERENAVAREAISGLITPAQDHAAGSRQASALEAFLRSGDTSGLMAVSDKAVELDMTPAHQMTQMIRSGMSADEVRAVYTDGGSSAGSLVVPTTFVRNLYVFMEASSALRRISRVIQTQSGEPMTFPKLISHAVGTQVIAQGTAIGGTDPVLGTMSPRLVPVRRPRQGLLRR